MAARVEHRGIVIAGLRRPLLDELVGETLAGREVTRVVEVSQHTQGERAVSGLGAMTHIGGRGDRVRDQFGVARPEPAVVRHRRHAGREDRMDLMPVPALLILRSRDENGTGRQPGQEEHQCRRVGVLGHLLDGDGETRDAGAGAAQLGRDAQAEETGGGEHLEEILRVLAGVVDLSGPRSHLVLGQTAHAGLELAQLLGELEVHGQRLPRAVPGRARAVRRYAVLRR